MKKSIGDLMFPQGWSFEEGLDLAQRAGFNGVELWQGRTPWFPMEIKDRDVLVLLRKVKNAGLEVSNVSDGLLRKYPLAARDAKIHARGFHVVERQIETAHLLGANAILVITGEVSEGLPYHELYQRLQDSLRQLAPKAEEAGVKIGLENGNSEDHFLLSPREFNQFLAEINSPWVGIHLDLGNIHDTGFAKQWVEILGPRITCIHVKDVMQRRGRCCDSVYTNLFLGDNNWPAIRNALLKVGYEGWLVAEMERRYRYALDQQFYDTAKGMDRVISGRL
ncbi:MAG TPA: sugar phosphate isomerase/epimerase family protein [Terriglobia bacterium]|nr:sugar phosphate isomerase/epimerase family protein [Terriglobia bacterium]